MRDYGVDAVQMHDMDFFISEARDAEFAERIAPLGIRWWALGRIDTLMQYSRRHVARRWRGSGLKMVFSGAESGSDATLAAMNKGGKASATLTLELARRMRHYGVVPEFSFVLGCAARSARRHGADVRVHPHDQAGQPGHRDHPVHLHAGADGRQRCTPKRRASASRFRSTLEEWASDEWQQLTMRRGDGIPWIDASVRRPRAQLRARAQRVLPDGDRPAAHRRRRRALLTARQRVALRAPKWYAAPYELRALQRLMHYQRPETTGF